ncbi:MAG: DUF3179 domain-containing protein [Bacteroidota bacterium]
MRAFTILFAGYLILHLASCGSAQNGVQPQANGSCDFSGDWLIPSNNVFDGGPGCDGIPALTDPELVSVNAIDFLEDDELVLVADDGPGRTKIYPHNVLDWHEIINDDVDNEPLAIVYCPLTGTGIGWSRRLNGSTTSFGVSGVLYNTNIVPYDRATSSNWSQQRMQCVNGERAGERPVSTNLIELRWEDARSLFPNALVSSDETGFNRNYRRYPYGDYRTNNDNLIFPLENDDSRLPRKERVLGVMDGTAAKAYRFSSFAATGWSLVTDDFAGRELILVGSNAPETIVVFDRVLADGTRLELSLTGEAGVNILQDQEGNVWDLTGRAVSGPRAGEKLRAPDAMMGYWFSWGAFYPEVEIY